MKPSNMTGIDLMNTLICISAIVLLVVLLVAFCGFVYVMERPEQFAKVVASMKAALPGKRD